MLAQPLHLSCLSNLSPPPLSLRLFKDSSSRAVTPLCFSLIYQLHVLLSFWFVPPSIWFYSPLLFIFHFSPSIAPCVAPRSLDLLLL